MQVAPLKQGEEAHSSVRVAHGEESKSLCSAKQLKQKQKCLLHKHLHKHKA